MQKPLSKRGEELARVMRLNDEALCRTRVPRMSSEDRRFMKVMQAMVCCLIDLDRPAVITMDRVCREFGKPVRTVRRRRDRVSDALGVAGLGGIIQHCREMVNRAREGLPDEQILSLTRRSQRLPRISCRGA